MSFLKYLFIFIFLHFVIASPQINLYFTDWVSNEQSDVSVQHNCLYITAPIEKEYNSHQVISYCMSESPTQWNIQNNHFNQIFTFAELYQKQITSEQLYFWSTPIDIIEHYQLFLNEYPNSINTSMATELFYNCTLPRFGPMCQYEFDNYKSNYLSLNEMINEYYFEHKYKPNTLTCYMHLECNRGPSPACLDWSEICDGKIDCFNNGLDEKYCWQLEINECEENEYRCANGQCIPFKFFQDNPLIPDCLDGSDELKDDEQSYVDCSISMPTFGCEDVTCTVYRPAKYFQYKTLLTSSCVSERNNLLAQAMFPNQSKSVSPDCWLALKCIVHMPISQEPQCLQLCQNKACDKIIENNCPDMMFTPDGPVLFGNIYFLHTRNHSKYSDRTDSPPRYICFSNKFCNEFLNKKELFMFNNTTCGRPHEFSLIFSALSGGSWLNKYILATSNLFSKCNFIINDDSILCNRPNMYRCINSSKCISIYRLSDGILDCYYDDDENIITLNNTSLSNVFKTHFKCIQANKYISYRLVKNGQCDCSAYDDDFCEDENLDVNDIKTHISFQTICDGFTELFPITIDGQNHTDETECEEWFCDNIYTHCNGIWNCLNGADEINCDSPPLLTCPSYHQICVSRLTNKLICLPFEKANDGNIDCIGATDEPKLCRSSYDKQVCDINRNISFDGGICFEENESIRSDVEKFLCSRLNNTKKQRIVYFSLDTIRNSKKETKLSSSSLIKSNISFENHCHRGINLRVWLDNKTKLTCLCPPNYYGNQCQYQNERISLTIELVALSDSWEIPFVIIILLIDDSYERKIHSYEEFIYLSTKDCQIKFNNYLIYSNRPKNSSNNYLIHIDIYEKISLNYRGSYLFPIYFSFLPIYRLSLQLIIPNTNNICSQNECIHGKCLKYFNNNNQTFCQCEKGWSGKYCTIKYNYLCSSNSLSLGFLSNNNRSICICPINKFGSKCLLNNSIFQLNKINPCFNNGQWIYFISNQIFFCICQKGFHGKQCQFIDNQIILSFNQNIILSQSIFIYFIQIINNSLPKRLTTFKTISTYQNLIHIYWSHPFNIIFIQLFNKTFYLVIRQNIYQQSTIIRKIIQPYDQCQHINQLFNYSFSQLHILRRIKYYHLLCQKSFSNLSCFYDDIHFCLCDYFGQQRQANCFEFDHHMKFDCFGQNSCENGAQCFQDHSTCPQTSICVCSTCFYGRRCQFTTSGFSFSLDAILGYHIEPYIPIVHQSITVQLSLAFTIIITIAGFINGFFLLITFKNKKLHEVGSGIYLLGSSIFTLLTITMFALKFFILLGAQMNNIVNRSFLHFQCISIDFILQISLHMDHWLNACVGCERAITSIKAIRFNKRKSKKAAKYAILILLVLMIITTIHDPLHRRLIDDDDEYGQNKRIWCIVSYSPRFQIFNSTINIIHFCGPFFINIISTIIIIRSAARQKATVQPQHTHGQHLYNQFQKHSRLLIAPMLLVILTLPRLIISFSSACMNAAENSWLFVTGYFVSFIPAVVTFYLFVFPSKIYRDEFNKLMKKYKMSLQPFFASFH